MKNQIEEHFEIEKSITTEIAQIETILKSTETGQIKLESIRAILTQLAGEIKEARKEKYYEDRTGLLASRFGDEFVEKEIEKSFRKKELFSIALIDVDFLKTINDRFGHVEGTRVIIELAEAIKAVLRKSDVASRYGGDEFLLIFPGTDLAKATNAISRIQSALFDRNKSAGIKIGISVGLAEFDYNKKETAQELIHRADNELYSKKATRVDPNES